MDNTFASQEVPTTNDTNVSVLYYARHTTGRTRLVYAVYALLGIFFYGIGIFTFLGFAMRTINGGAFFAPETIVLSCYVLLNSLIGHGFMFHRKWLITTFTIQAIFMGLMAEFSYSRDIADRGESLLVIVLVTIGTLVFLFLTKKILSGRYAPLQIILPFVVILLLSFTLTNLSMLN